MNMGYLDSQNAYQKGQRGELMSPTDPNYGSFLQGQADAGPRGSWGEMTAFVTGGLRAYLEVLFGAPIGFGVIAGVVALVAGGNFVMAALIAAGVTFAVVLLIGALYVTFRLAIAFAPLLIVVAIVLYVLHHWFGVGPGL
jgi:hypothetical protein